MRADIENDIELGRWTRRTFVSVVCGALVSSAFACNWGPDCLLGGQCTYDAPIGGQNGEDPDADGTGADDPDAPACSEEEWGRPHIGLGGEDLASTINQAAHADRARVKPYTALVTEYSRVLGGQNNPSLIATTGGTFGQPNDRWFIEPIASAVLINTAFDVAFEGCLRLTGDISGGSADPKYATAPTPETAKAECAGWIRRFWSRHGTPEQIDACASVALETTTETYGGGATEAVTREASPRRRWAYACASVLSSTGFLMY